MSEKECLAIVRGSRTWRLNQQGEDLEVLTDHHSLVWLMENSLLRGRLARRVRTIQNGTFSIVHWPGDTLVVADVLSRDVSPPPTCPHCNELLNSVQKNGALPMADKLKTAMRKELGLLV